MYRFPELLVLTGAAGIDKEFAVLLLFHLAVAGQSLADDMPEDFYSIDLMDAYRELGLIIGESVEDDLVNEIFAKFCMGK